MELFRMDNIEERNTKDESDDTGDEQYLETKGALFFSRLNCPEENIQDMCGIVRTGELMGVIGPTGSGKTTFLNMIVGKEESTHDIFSMSGLSPSETKDRITFVPKKVFRLPDLTVQETIKFAWKLDTSNMCIPNTSHNTIESIMNEFGLTNVLDKAVRCLSEAESTRLNIILAVMRNTDILILDEPLSHLGFSDSLHILQTVRNFADVNNKIIIMSLQPGPSILYNFFSKFTFICSGKFMFQGDISETHEVIHRIGVTKISEYSCIDKFYGILCDISRNPDTLQHEVLKEQSQKRRIELEKRISILDRWFFATQSSQSERSSPVTSHKIHIYSPKDSLVKSFDTEINSYDAIEVEHKHQIIGQLNNRKCSLSLIMTRMCILTSRNLMNTRRRLLSYGALLQNAYILLLCVAIWWRPARNENTIKDRMGLFFFMTVQWAFFALLDAVITFAEEINVIIPEIRQLRYGVFEFCVSKTLSDIPITVLQPVIFLGVIYWVANLHGIGACIGSVGVLVINILTTQSLGLVIGSVFRLPWNVTVMALSLLSMMLLGGAFNTPPPWMGWGRYLSLFNYGVDAFAVLEFQNAEPIKCYSKSTYPGCIPYFNTTSPTVVELPSETILTMLGITWSVGSYISVLTVLFVVLRLIWGLILYLNTR